MLPADTDQALQARIWDRVIDGYVATPVQTIVGDALQELRDPQRVGQARGTLDLAGSRHHPAHEERL
jgi:glutathione S-transferase